MSPGASGLQMKMGLNKWQDIVTEDMQKAEALANLDASNWWSIDLSFDEVTSQKTKPSVRGRTRSHIPVRSTVLHSHMSALQVTCSTMRGLCLFPTRSFTGGIQGSSFRRMCSESILWL